MMALLGEEEQKEYFADLNGDEAAARTMTVQERVL